MTESSIPIQNNSKPTLKMINNYVNTYKNLFNIGRSAQFQYMHTHDLFSEAKQKISKIYN